MAGLRIRTANCHFENLHLPKYKKKKQIENTSFKSALSYRKMVK